MRPNLSFYNIVSREEKENIVKLREYKKFSRGQRLVSKGKPYPRKIKKKEKKKKKKKKLYGTVALSKD